MTYPFALKQAAQVAYIVIQINEIVIAAIIPMYISLLFFGFDVDLPATGFSS